jgi:hypothetical protein
MNEDDSIESLLHLPTETVNDVLRAELLRHTSRRVRWHRRTRTLSRMGLLAACFVGGMGAMALVQALSLESRTVTVVVSTALRPVDPAAQPRRATPAELELEAERTFVRTESAQRFREAGDGYLRELADHRAALRCYRNFLDEADEADLVVLDTDTWLLTSLKNARRKEILNANADN